MTLFLLVTLLLYTAKCHAYSHKTEIEQDFRTDASYCDFRLDVMWNRLDCGQPNSTKEWCESRGCCWDPNKDNVVCFYPNLPEQTRYLSDLGRRRRSPGIKKEADFGNCACRGIEIRSKGPSPRPFNVTCEKDTKNDVNVPSCSTTKDKTSNTKQDKNSNTKQGKKSKTKKEKEKNSNKKQGKNFNNVNDKGCNSGAPRNKAIINCVYTGNPHNCAAYNNGHQGTFYEQLLKAIGNEMCDTLNLPVPTCPDETFNTKICQHIDYTLKN